MAPRCGRGVRYHLLFPACPRVPVNATSKNLVWYITFFCILNFYFMKNLQKFFFRGKNKGTRGQDKKQKVLKGGKAVLYTAPAN